jgi:deoxycytidylate deaminase
MTPEIRRLLDEPPSHIIDLAVEVSVWSPCRSKRGVVVFRGENVVAHGYNYKPRGFECDGTDACKATCRDEAVHAEQQALLSSSPRQADGADLLHVKTVDGQLVASGGPSCVQCSKLALACGIAGVWLYLATGWRRYDMQTFHRLSLEAALLALPADLPPPEAPKEEDLSRVAPPVVAQAHGDLPRSPPRDGSQR